MEENVWPVIMDLIKKQDHDPEHSFQVCHLSLELFDELYPLLHLTRNDRSLIRAAALLHDIGWSNSDKPHHKASRDLIMNDNMIPFSQKERVMVALVARYHRKSVPNPAHTLYRELSLELQMIVRSCAAFLRVADALDRSHRQIVIDLTCVISSSEIIIQYFSNSPLSYERNVFTNKSQLLSDLTSRSIILRWNQSSQE
jgi:exopolyphosphatase / guanosine-5'-triphosphate,3'-diphosphate pyrophosphatase